MGGCWSGAGMRRFYWFVEARARRSTLKGKTMLLVGTLTAGLVGAVPALAQTPVVEDDLGQVRSRWWIV